MSAKTHILLSSEPVREGSSIRAVCGEEVPDSVFTFRSIGGKLDEAWGNTLLFCPKCIGKLIVSFPGLNYVYGCRRRLPRDGEGVEAA